MVFNPIFLHLHFKLNLVSLATLEKNNRNFPGDLNVRTSKAAWCGSSNVSQRGPLRTVLSTWINDFCQSPARVCGPTVDIRWEKVHSKGPQKRGREIEEFICASCLGTHKELFLKMMDLRHRLGSITADKFLMKIKLQRLLWKTRKPEVALGMNLNVLLGLMQNWLQEPSGSSFGHDPCTCN